MNEYSRVASVVPFSLKDTPSFIERQMPVGRISAETYKERKAGAGQTLTALGSYWKGRKPLILVRATILGCLLPATAEPLEDLRIFLLLMGMDDAAFARRIKAVSPKDIDPDWSKYASLVENEDRPIWHRSLSTADRKLDWMDEVRDQIPPVVPYATEAYLTEAGQTYIACSFACRALVGGRCSIYEDRPGLCRRFVAGSDALCVEYDPQGVRAEDGGGDPA